MQLQKYNFLVHRKLSVLVRFCVSGGSLHILENSGFVWGQNQDDQKSDFYAVYSNHFLEIKKTIKPLKKIHILFFIIWKIINSEVISRPHKNFSFFIKIGFLMIFIRNFKFKNSTDTQNICESYMNLLEKFWVPGLKRKILTNSSLVKFLVIFAYKNPFVWHLWSV